MVSSDAGAFEVRCLAFHGLIRGSQGVEDGGCEFIAVELLLLVATAAVSSRTKYIVAPVNIQGFALRLELPLCNQSVKLLLVLHYRCAEVLHIYATVLWLLENATACEHLLAFGRRRCGTSSCHG